MDSSAVTETESSVEIKPKMHFTGKVVKISLAGAAIDIGQAKPAVLHVSQIVPPDEEPIKRVNDVLTIGQDVEVWVKRVKEDHVELTMFKPLDLEWRDLKKGMTVKGTVVRLEKFGAFVEIGAERPGLVHISEMAHGYVKQPSDIVKEGDEVEAEVLDVNRRKKQIKLSMKALLPEPIKVEEPVRSVEMPQPKERPARKPQPKKSPRRKNEDGTEISDELLANLNGDANAEAEPTFMEIAIRAAMEKAKVRKQEQARKAKSVSSVQDDILARTLQSKPNA
jgi:predicted RNA-binding protein with RPS1 domain